jgi:hypothetical protein
MDQLSPCHECKRELIAVKKLISLLDGFGEAANVDAKTK